MLFIMGRYERAMRKLKAQQRTEYYARKRELAGLPLYYRRGPLQKMLTVRGVPGPVASDWIPREG
jgi:hypothetical protein